MNTSAEWNDLIRVWQEPLPAEDAGGPNDLRRRVLAESRRLTLTLLAEYAVGLGIVCFVAWRLATVEGPETFVWGFAVLWFAGMALQFTSDNRRGLWVPVAESTRAYVELALERIARRENSVRFAWRLFALQVAVLLAWYPATWFLWPERTWSLIERTPLLLGWLALVTLALFGWSTAARNRNARERAEFERLRAELSAAD